MKNLFFFFGGSSKLLLLCGIFTQNYTIIDLWLFFLLLGNFFPDPNVRVFLLVCVYCKQVSNSSWIHFNNPLWVPWNGLLLLHGMLKNTWKWFHFSLDIAVVYWFDFWLFCSFSDERLRFVAVRPTASHCVNPHLF